MYVPHCGHLNKCNEDKGRVYTGPQQHEADHPNERLVPAHCQYGKHYEPREHSQSPGPVPYAPDILHPPLKLDHRVFRTVLRHTHRSRQPSNIQIGF